jgi:hypothetical protein
MSRYIRDTVTVRMSPHDVRNWTRAIVLIAGLLQAAPAVVYGDETPKATGSDEIQQLIEGNRQLSQQVQDLQSRVKQLEAKVNEAAPAAPGGAHALEPSATTAPSLSSPSPPAPPTTVQELEPPAAPPPGVKLRLFGDLGYSASDKKGETNSFHVGSLDLFMTGSLSNGMSILGEVLFVPRTDNSITADVERLLLQYRHNDYFNFAIGRYHTSIGYYNTAFHQGAWFQTAIDRPFMYAFDDNGGFLPLQEVGITINGQIPSGKLGLNYVAEMGNGTSTGTSLEPAQNAQDANNGKSFNLALFARPRWVPGLQAGFSIYHDNLTFPNHDDHSELISTVHVVYRNSNYEFLNEGMLVRHGPPSIGTGAVFHTTGFYTQISRRFGELRPYFRYAYINASLADPIYGEITDVPELISRRNGPTIGVRYDFSEHAAVKFQFDHFGLRGQNSSNRLSTQFSFAF